MVATVILAIEGVIVLLLVLSRFASRSSAAGALWHRIWGQYVRFKIGEPERFRDLMAFRLSMGHTQERFTREHMLNEAITVYDYMIRRDLVTFEDGFVLFDQRYRPPPVDDPSQLAEAHVPESNPQSATLWERLREDDT